MMERLGPEDFIGEQDSLSLPIIDVRSPGEFEKGHIPGAFSLPLFENDERAIVGTLYKQQGPRLALHKGLDIVGPKMSGLLKSTEKIARNGKVRIHCWRGGMRSNSMAWLLRTGGFEVSVLEGGYKAFRQWTQDLFVSTWKIQLLGGRTGSGKTDILRAMAQSGEQVIDLEGLANHKGSAFGSLGQLPQPTIEQFENELAFVLKTVDPKKPVWLEDESVTIGRVCIPKPFWEQMTLAPMWYVDVPVAQRVSYLVEEYGLFSPEFLAESVEKITRRLGGLASKQIQTAIFEGDLALAAGSLLEYYDKAYDLTLKKREIRPSFYLNVDPKEPESAAKIIRDNLLTI